MSKVDATKAVGLIAAAWFSQPFPEPAQRMYVESLTDLQGDILIAAVWHLIQTEKYLPHVSDIREAVDDLKSSIWYATAFGMGEMAVMTGRHYSPLVLKAIERISSGLLPAGDEE